MYQFRRQWHLPQCFNFSHRQKTVPNSLVPVRAAHWIGSPFPRQSLFQAYRQSLASRRSFTHIAFETGFKQSRTRSKSFWKLWTSETIFLKLRSGYLRLNMCPRWTKLMSNLEAGTDTVPGTTPQYYLIGQRVPDAFDIIAHSHSNHNPQISNEPIRNYFTPCGQTLLYNHYQGSSKKRVSWRGRLKTKYKKSNKTSKPFLYV